MRPQVIAACVVSVFLLIVSVFFWHGLVGYNNDQDWQIYQSLTGKITVIDRGGPYAKWFGQVWTYPRAMEAEYTHNDKGTGSAIQVGFNDGGTAWVSSFVRVQLPTEAEQRHSLHRNCNGSVQNIVNAVRSHLTNCLKATGPVMSASENQASRKAEFNQLIEQQLEIGLFAMRRTQVELDDLATVEEGGKERKARVQATEIVYKDGKPEVIQPSPLKQYGISILQFSVTEIAYDQQTLAQFSAKKDSYLNAEKSKAQRQEEVQQRLMIEERGRRQIADVQAEQNQIKERANIVAQQAAEVAVKEKTKAVTDAQRVVEVAEQQKRQAEVQREIARIAAETAELQKAATISQAEAKQKQLQLAGGISDEKRVLAEIARDRDVGVATALANVHTPGVIMSGGQGGDLLNLVLLRTLGVLPTEKKGE